MHCIIAFRGGLLRRECLNNNRVFFYQMKLYITTMATE